MSVIMNFGQDELFKELTREKLLYFMKNITDE